MNMLGTFRNVFDLGSALRHVGDVFQFAQSEQQRLMGNPVPLRGDLFEVCPKGGVAVESGERVGQSAEGHLAQVLLREVDGEVGLELELRHLNDKIEIDAQNLLHELESLECGMNGVAVLSLRVTSHLFPLWHNAPVEPPRGAQRPRGPKKRGRGPKKRGR